MYYEILRSYLMPNKDKRRILKNVFSQIKDSRGFKKCDFCKNLIFL